MADGSINIGSMGEFIVEGPQDGTLNAGSIGQFIVEGPQDGVVNVGSMGEFIVEGPPDFTPAHPNVITNFGMEVLVSTASKPLVTKVAIEVLRTISDAQVLVGRRRQIYLN